MGVLRNNVEELQQMLDSMEDVVIVDLDDDRVILTSGQENDAKLLPPFVAPLRVAIEETVKRTRSRVPLPGIPGIGKKKYMRKAPTTSLPTLSASGQVRRERYPSEGARVHPVE